MSLDQLNTEQYLQIGMLAYSWIPDLSSNSLINEKEKYDALCIALMSWFNTYSSVSYLDKGVKEQILDNAKEILLETNSSSK